MNAVKILFLATALAGLLVTAAATVSAQGRAITMRITMYDDGRACPANCDSHVVFHRKNNGTANAHLPGSEAPNFKKCEENKECRICFDGHQENCMVIMYRGNGPHENTFDFTSAFFEQTCPMQTLPRPLASKCRELMTQARQLNDRLNCIRDNQVQQCSTIVAEAKAKKEADLPVYNACVQQGETAFNRGRPVSQQRRDNCLYEKKGTGGPNSRGRTWRKLLPAACRDDTYVGRDGLDCCVGIPLHDGSLDIECAAFYPRH